MRRANYRSFDAGVPIATNAVGFSRTIERDMESRTPPNIPSDTAASEKVVDTTMEIERGDLWVEPTSSALPFAPTAEPTRAPRENTADGALPFRPALHSLLRIPPVPTPGIRTEALPRRSPATRSEGDDPFRRAFPFRGGAERKGPKRALELAAQALAMPSPVATPEAFSVRSSSDAAAASPLAPLGSPAPRPPHEIAEPRRPIERFSHTDPMPRPQAVRSPAVFPPPSDAGTKRRAVVDLLSVDRNVAERLRRSKTHGGLLSGLASRKLDLAGEETPDERARRDVLAVLSWGHPVASLSDVDDSLFDDARDFDLPLLLVEGDVKPTMDEVEALRLAAHLAKPLAAKHPRLLEAIAIANEALASSGPIGSESATSLTKRIEASMNELSLPPRYLADLVERALVGGRHFKKKTLFGAPRIRAEIAVERVAIPLYLPEAVGEYLPLLPVVSLRALVELRPREDVSEPHPDGLLAFAVARVLRSRTFGT